jgi:pyrroloquinoline quinone (PQQ) biosynthesis protein C
MTTSGLLNSLVLELKAHPVNTNPFFVAFGRQPFTKGQLQEWLAQYHYFCKHFVKLLEGLLYRTPLDQLEMRVELAKTLHSELGSGSSDQAHVRLLERFAGAAGLHSIDLARTVPIPQVAQYLHLLEQLFVEADYLVALGAELAVEVTAGAEFQYFYPGLLQYGEFSAHDLMFFELHLETEVDHGAWLMNAVSRTAKSQADFDQVARGARATADAWEVFWKGMYRHVLHAPHLSF